MKGIGKLKGCVLHRPVTTDVGWPCEFSSWIECSNETARELQLMVEQNAAVSITVVPYDPTLPAVRRAALDGAATIIEKHFFAHPAGRIALSRAELAVLLSMACEHGFELAGK